MTPKLKRRIDELGDERAVSPVIGVILMVAITVILAAVIGTFVLDLGQSAGQSAPQASLSVTVSGDTVTIEHTGGDAIVGGETRVIIEEGGVSETTNDPWSGTLTVGNSESITFSDGISTGNQVTVTVIDTDTQRQIFETTVTA